MSEMWKPQHIEQLLEAVVGLDTPRPEAFRGVITTLAGRFGKSNTAVDRQLWGLATSYRTTPYAQPPNSARRPRSGPFSFGEHLIVKRAVQGNGKQASKATPGATAALLLRPVVEVQAVWDSIAPLPGLLDQVQEEIEDGLQDDNPGGRGDGHGGDLGGADLLPNRYTSNVPPVAGPECGDE